MHRNEIFYALICINNHVLSCLISMLSASVARMLALRYTMISKGALWAIRGTHMAYIKGVSFQLSALNGLILVKYNITLFIVVESL